MATTVPQIGDHTKIAACIGNVCIQWALLETIMLGIISAAENMPMEKVKIMFGSLDMLPRCGMAINLTRHARWPQRFITRLEKIRTRLQGPKGVAERRNQAVHGVHAHTDTLEHVELTMMRWKGPKMTQEVSIRDLYTLGTEIHALSQEAWSIWGDYGTWKFGDHRPEDFPGERPEVSPGVWLKITQYLNARVDHLGRWLRG